MLSLATLAVAEAAGTARAEVDEALEELPGGERARFFQMPGSASPRPMLRRRVRARAADQVPGPRRGRRYIDEHRLYGGSPQLMTPEELAAAIAEYAADRKALDIVQLDLRGIHRLHRLLRDLHGPDRPPGEGDPRRHPQGAEGRLGILPRRVEGVTQARWILMDYLDVVVHVFTPDTREYYRLEQLWGEAPARELSVAAAR